MKKLISLALAACLLLNCGIPVGATGDSQASAEDPAVLAEWEAALGEFSITPANAYTPVDAENLLSAGEKAHAYALPEDAAGTAGEYVPGEVLFARSGGGILSSLMGEGPSLDSELAALGVVNAEALYTEKQNQDSGILFSVFGLGDTSTTWYRAEVTGSVLETVEALKSVNGISDAEPNYIYTTDSIGEPEEAERQESWFLNSDADKKGLSASSGWKQAIRMNGKAPGEGAVVAVIDTGVDYTHPDLASSMWVNAAEFGGVAGVDDDGNGYIDDIYGINATGNINKPTDPMDDNGHGTHVAGIIAMANNKTGGVGIAYGAKIMAIKAGQSTGTFAASDIVEAIEYAQSMGADVINMSFGGTGRSNLIEAALESAFSTCVLVASAGNNGRPTTDAPGNFIQKEDIYPAGYRYVLGVMASDNNGGLASFSNWDYCANLNCEYELAAPGTNVFSTLPGNRYAKWNGTSMAAPCVSAAAAILRGCYTDKDEYNSRFIMGQLASATETDVTYVDIIEAVHTYPKLDLYQSLTCLPKPNLSVAEVFALDNKDTDAKNDGDRIMDAGETVDLGISIRNQWGKTGTVTVRADAISDGGVANPFVSFVNDTVTLEPIGAYSSADNGFVYEDSYLASVSDPIRFTLDPDTPNDAQIRINLTVTTTNGWDENDQTVYTIENPKPSFTFRVQNGCGISGELTKDTTLTADTYWIVENTVFIPEGITLTVEPGAQIQFYSSDYEDAYGGLTMPAIVNYGTLNMIGTEEKPISLFPGAGFETHTVTIYNSYTSGTDTLRYCTITNPSFGWNPSKNSTSVGVVDVVDHCNLIQSNPRQVWRYLSSGTVHEQGFNTYSKQYSFKVGTLTNSRLSGFASQGEYGSAPIEGRSIYTVTNGSNVFVDCVIASNSGKNSVFLSGGSGGLPGSSFSHQILVPKVEPAVPDKTIYHCESAGSKYIAVKNIYPDACGRLGNAYASALGGTLLCLDGSEEEVFIHELLASTQLGHISLDCRFDAASGEYIWGDGHSYTPSAPLSPDYYNPSATHPQVMMHYSSSKNTCYIYGLEQLDGERMPQHHLIEVPDTMSDAEILAIVDSINTQQLVFDLVSTSNNNAYLNPLLNTDPTTWSNFNAGSYSTSAYAYKLAGNYWGTENKNLINKMINDSDDFAGQLANIIEDPILTLDDDLSDIYPFVTQIWLTENDSDNVVENAAPGVTYDVHVTYNRDMEPTVQPTVTYGGEAPFTDYRVYGDWVSAREWVGTTKISGVATGGNQIFRAVGGCAADDHWLVCGTDELRFQFNIAAASAQSVVLNAAGDVGEVELTWAQNEYEVLGGYNLYRSTDPAKSFTKVNDAIVSDCFYTDTNVEPGVTYYYYYTIVDTDGNEIADARSNVASATPTDNIRPVITHTAVNRANAGSAVTVAAVVTDNIAVDSVTLWYRTVGTQTYSSVAMNYMNATGKYTGSIPKAAVTASGVEYYIEAFDNNGNRQTSGSIAVPYRITTAATPTLLTAFPSVLDVGSTQTVTVYGSHLAQGMTVMLGTEEIETYTVSEDGSSISFTAPALPIGTYSVTVSLNGQTAGLTNAVTYREPGSYVQINSGSVLSGEVLRLPVYVGVTGELTAFRASVSIPTTHFSAAAVELAEGVNGSLASNYSGGTLTFSVASGSNFNPGSQNPLAYLVLTPKAVQSETLAHLTLTSGRLNGAETITGDETTAVTVYPNFSVNVRVKYYQGQTPVSDVTIQAAGVSATTDATGAATLTRINRPDVILLASKQGYTEGDVEAYDAVLALRSSVGLETLSEHQLIAGDVNLDGNVDEVDAALILKKCVFLIDRFPAGSWAFAPASKSVTLTGNTQTVDFIAILIGDIDGSWKGLAE